MRVGRLLAVFVTRIVVIANVGDGRLTGQSALIAPPSPTETLANIRSILTYTDFATIDRSQGPMPYLSSYLTDPSVLIGFRAINRSLGSGVVTAVVRKDSGGDYVRIRFDDNGLTLEFGADIFLGKWGDYFSHSLDDILNVDRALRELVSSLRKTSISQKRNSSPLLSNQDYRLCLAWAGLRSHAGVETTYEQLEEQLGSYESTRLMSARQAELVAIAYFRELGCTVHDISITQLDISGTSQWKDFDILVDGQPVDIKNARQSFGNPAAYVEHCVPRFKVDRATNIDVRILGVLSEYKQPTDIAVGRGDCVILGEVNGAVLPAPPIRALT